MMRYVLGLLLAAPLTQAATGERAEIEARFLREQQACQANFAVNACVDEAKLRRSAALKPLQAREQAQDAQARQARARAQEERVSERQRQAALENGQRLGKSLVAPSLAASAAAAKPPRASASQQARTAENEARQAAQLVQTAALRRERMLQRQREQQAHQAKVQQREAQRKASGKKPAAPLPQPGTASAPKAAASS